MKRAYALIMVAGMIAAVLVSAGCSDNGRPSATEWQATWTTAANTLPTFEQVGNPPDRELCSHALGELRAIQTELIPTPDAALDAVVEEWVRVAEDAMFECPPSSAALPNLRAAYDELARLKAEVDVVLQIDLEAG